MEISPVQFPEVLLEESVKAIAKLLGSARIAAASEVLV